MATFTTADRVGAIGGYVGTILSLLEGAGITAGAGANYATKDDIAHAREIAYKDSEIALLKSEQNTEIKIADVYERIMTRVNQDQREQAAWNASQSVANAQVSAAIATNAASIGALQALCGNLTKTVIPIANVCPEPMQRYNSWTSPTAASGTGG